MYESSINSASTFIPLILKPLSSSNSSSSSSNQAATIYSHRKCKPMKWMEMHKMTTIRWGCTATRAMSPIYTNRKIQCQQSIQTITISMLSLVLVSIRRPAAVLYDPNLLDNNIVMCPCPIVWRCYICLARSHFCLSSIENLKKKSLQIACTNSAIFHNQKKQRKEQNTNHEKWMQLNL